MDSKKRQYRVAALRSTAILRGNEQVWAAQGRAIEVLLGAGKKEDVAQIQGLREGVRVGLGGLFLGSRPHANKGLAQLWDEAAKEILQSLKSPASLSGVFPSGWTPEGGSLFQLDFGPDGEGRFNFDDTALVWMKLFGGQADRLADITDRLAALADRQTQSRFDTVEPSPVRQFEARRIAGNSMFVSGPSPMDTGIEF